MNYPGTMADFGLPWWFSGKESTCQCGDAGDARDTGWIPWRRKWQPPPAFLPEKSPRQRNLVGGKELYATEDN